MSAARSSLKRPAAANSGIAVAKSASLKKARFVEPSEEPAAFAEQVDSALEAAPRRKRNVKTDGYESDSTDDGEGVVLSRRKSAEDQGGDGLDDMFDAGEREQKEEERPGKKEKQYLRLGDIEGQEFGAGANSGSSDEEDEPEDEDDAERRKKAGMGYEMSSFNMREEMEEGKFAADGTYVRSFDPHGIHDRWMEGLDEKDIKLARRRKKERDRQQREKVEAEEREIQQRGGKEELEKALLSMLKKGETVLEALQRFGARAKKNKQASKQKTNRNAASKMDVDGPAIGLSDIELITHLASNLMSLGDPDVYSKTYEQLVRSVRSAGNVEPSWAPPSADVKYEFKWDVPDSTARSGETFGPFSETEMKSWHRAMYFGVAGEKVKVRQAGGEWGDWDDIMT